MGRTETMRISRTPFGNLPPALAILGLRGSRGIHDGSRNIQDGSGGIQDGSRSIQDGSRGIQDGSRNIKAQEAAKTAQ
eukprot:6635868-Pyramimonas_sp.AAC.1